MESDFGEYNLSCELRGHDDDVRGICVCGDSGIATSSRDRTIRFWSPDPSIKHKYTSKILLGGHTSLVGPLAWIFPSESFPEGRLVSGGMDTLVLLWDLRTGEIVQTMKGHQLQVSALTIDDNADIISGSVDCTVRRWREGQQVESWEAHKAAVQTVMKLPSGELVTGSSDSTLKLWRGKTCMHTFVGHTGTVRGLAVMPDVGVLSASHDGSIRLWALTGQVLMEMVGHTSIIYSVHAHVSGLIVSGSEDGSVKIWKDRVCVQSIEHPGCVWDAKFMENGDIVTACSDGVVRIWTTNKDRIADPNEVEAYASQLSLYTCSRKRFGGLKSEELPGMEALHTPGTTDGQTKIVREGDNGVACSWNSKDQQCDKSRFEMDSSKKSLDASSSSRPPSEAAALLHQQPSTSASVAGAPRSHEMTRSMPNKKVKVVFVWGAPGSGKSTQCRKIAQLFGFIHLSPGDLLQTETGSGSEYSTMIHTMIQNIMNEGKLVPSKLTVKLLQRAMHKTMEYKFLIDGFPFDQENLAEWKNAVGIEPKLVLYFHCSEEVIVSRLKNKVREDDLDKRFKLFSKDSPPLIKHFDSNGTLGKINAGRSVEEVFEEIKVFFSRKDPDLDLDDCQLSEAFEDPTEMEALRAQFTPTEKLNLGKRSELTKKLRTQMVGSAQRRIRMALKDLGLKHEDFSYLDGLTSEAYLNNLRDLVLVMAGRQDNPVAPKPIKSTDVLTPWDSKSIPQMAELGIKEVEGTFYCAECDVFEKAKVDWRVGFVCLASYLLGTMFQLGLTPPSDPGLHITCVFCYKKAVPCPCPEKGWDFLFLALTYSIGLCPREVILGYLRRQKILIASDISQDLLLFTFYMDIITKLDPTNVGWNYLSCPVGAAVST